MCASHNSMDRLVLYVDRYFPNSCYNVELNRPQHCSLLLMDRNALVTTLTDGDIERFNARQQLGSMFTFCHSHRVRQEVKLGHMWNVYVYKCDSFLYLVCDGA